MHRQPLSRPYGSGTVFDTCPEVVGVAVAATLAPTNLGKLGHFGPMVGWPAGIGPCHVCRSIVDLPYGGGAKFGAAVGAVISVHAPGGYGGRRPYRIEGMGRALEREEYSVAILFVTRFG